MWYNVSSITKQFGIGFSFSFNLSHLGDSRYCHPPFVGEETEAQWEMAFQGWIASTEHHGGVNPGLSDPTSKTVFLLPCGWSCLIPTLRGSDGTGSCPTGTDRSLWSHLWREPHRGNQISNPSPHHGHRSNRFQRLGMCFMCCFPADSPSETTAGEILPLGSSRQQSHLHLNSLQTWCCNKSSREVGNKWAGFEGSSQCHELLWAHYMGYFIESPSLSAH